MAEKPGNYPIHECFKTASELTAAGMVVFQKFSCEQCGVRLMIEDANTFYTTGHCDQCGHITDIRKKGCNYAVVIAVMLPMPIPGLKIVEERGSGTVH